jgi:hypothetical protein
VFERAMTLLAMRGEKGDASTRDSQSAFHRRVFAE